MHPAKILTIKPNTKPQKATRTTVDTIAFDREQIASWELPAFQRPLKLNDKVVALAETIKRDGGVIPGVITLGVLGGQTYLLDGQHRRAAFMQSGMESGYTDVRIHHFDNMGEMGEEFVRLNSQLVRMRPDDILRGLELSYEPLRRLREKCPFIGYDMIRRGTNAPIVSMALVLRGWRSSSCEVPASHGVASSAAALAVSLTNEDSNEMIRFLSACFEAWGRDQEYMRLWGGLNLVLCMWLYRRTVMQQNSVKSIRLTREQFKKCLMSLSAESDYLDYLTGRSMGERDRSPTYGRMKHIFAARIASDTGQKALLPAPAWASNIARPKK